MQIVEIRDLDGPNLFLLKPAIKLEYLLTDTIDLSPAVSDLLFSSIPESELPKSLPAAAVMNLLGEVVSRLHELAGAESPDQMAMELEEPNHFVVAFAWERRAFATTLAKTAFDVVAGNIVDLEEAIEELANLLMVEPSPSDLPAMMGDDKRSIPVIGITGTNGKTTTTRLIASVLSGIGRTVGYTSSSGVVIKNKTVVEGDYTGPAGARMVFDDPDVDIAVLETARGGILLRGLGYESNDVSVVTNVAADHLGLLGIHSVEALRDVKSVVARVTQPDGFVVLNADNELSRSIAPTVSASVILFGKDRSTPAIAEHLEQGGWAVFVRDGVIVSEDGDGAVEIARLEDVPMTFGGRASHMVENALAGTAALLAAGLTPKEVRNGLARFHNESAQNRGRMNVFEVRGGTVILDFAHNQQGLELLLRFGRQMTQDIGRLYAIVGTAGDRTDEALRELGRLSGELADVIYFKDTEKYLRGRDSGDLPRLMREGLTDTNAEVVDFPWERPALLHALDEMVPGDVVAMMCIEDYDFLCEHLNQLTES